MDEILLKYLQSLHPDKLVGITECGIVCDMVIIKYWCRTEFEHLEDLKIEGIPEGGIKSAAIEKWVKYSEVLNREDFFTWCVNNIDDYDSIIDLNAEWDSNAELI